MTWSSLPPRPVECKCTIPRDLWPTLDHSSSTVMPASPLSRRTPKDGGGRGLSLWSYEMALVPSRAPTLTIIPQLGGPTSGIEPLLKELL
jgi:hypothetical protein